MKNFVKNLLHELRCRLFHRGYQGDQQFELVELPRRGLSPSPALWRVWTYCRKCGRGWTRMVKQKEKGIDYHGKHTTFCDGPFDLPAIPDASFRTVDGNPREDKSEGHRT